MLWVMLDRESCERRVYRLATLLTGDPRAATAVISRVVDAQPDLRRLDSAHMDRLTVLRSREIPPMILTDPSLPPEVAEALANLPAQQREAWIFSRVYQLTEREMSRSMDCSTSAITLHLRAAEQTLSRAGHMLNVDDAARSLLAYSMSLDVPAFYRLQRQRRARMKWVVRMAIFTLAVLALICAVMWWTGRAGRDGSASTTDAPTAAPPSDDSASPQP